MWWGPGEVDGCGQRGAWCRATAPRPIPAHAAPPPSLPLQTFFARTHLGHLLHAGDSAVGYDVANANLVDPELEKAVHKVGGRGCAGGRCVVVLLMCAGPCVRRDGPGCGLLC